MKKAKENLSTLESTVIYFSLWRRWLYVYFLNSSLDIVAKIGDGYPSELFKLDMERLGIAAKRKPAKVIDFTKYIDTNRSNNH